MDNMVHIKSHMKKMIATVLTALTAFGFSGFVFGQMQIEITGVGQTQYPIAVTRFLNESGLPSYVTDVVRSDLANNGNFANVERGETEIAENAKPDFSMWSSRRAQALAIGTVTPLPNGQYEVKYRLYDVAKNQSLGGTSATVFVKRVMLSSMISSNA